jgi:hypothetical protein
MKRQRLLSPTWVLSLTNDELSSAFDSAYAAYDAAKWEDANIGHRLDVIGNEISRRELAGTWTEDDWKAKA